MVAAYVLALCVAPLGRLFVETLFPAQGSVSDIAQSLLHSRSVRKAVYNTLESGLASTVLSLGLGTFMALLIGLTDIRRKTLLVFMLMAPMLIPAQITAVSWLELLGPSSPLLKPLGYALEPGTRNPLYSRWGVIMLLAVEHAGMVFLAVRAGLRAIPRDLIEAGRSVGAGPLRICCMIILPLLRPSLIAGCALAFVASIGNFGIPALLGIPGRYLVLSTLIYQRLSSFGPSVLGEVGGLSMILAALAGLGLLVQHLSRRNQVQLTEGGRLEPPFTLGRWRLPVEAAVWLVLLFLAVLPLLALVGTALIPALGVALSPATITLDNFHFVFEHGGTRRAFANSAFLGLAAAALVVLVSLPLSYLVVIRRNRVAALLNIFADAPFALPGIVLSIACIIAFIRPLPVLGFSLYNTIWIILVAYLARFLAFGLRPAFAGMEQIDTTLEEAAQIAGAGCVTRLRRIIAPIALPSAMAGGILVFMGAFNELTVSSLLWSAGNETLGVVIYNLYDEGNSTGASAVAVLAVCVTLAIAGVASFFMRKLPRGVLPWQE